MTVFPSELTSRQQWLLWRFEQQEGDKKPRKVPYYANGNRRTGEQGSPQDRAKLVDYDTAMALVAGYDGVGFAFLPDDGLIGVDLDACINTDDEYRKRLAASVIKKCASFTEFSPSGNGVHIILSGTCRTFKSNDIGVEVFCGRQFFTMTGNVHPESAATIGPMTDELLQRFRRVVDEAKEARKGKQAAVTTQTSQSSVIPQSATAKVESALAYISPDCGYDDWIKIGMAIHAELGAGAQGVWDYWSRKGSKYCGEAAIASHWRSFDGGGVTGGTLFRLAMDAGWRPPLPPAPAKPAPAPAPAPTPADEPVSPPANDNAPKNPIDRSGDHQFFRILGFDRGDYYVFQLGRKQMIRMTKADMTTSGFLELAPLEYWATYFPSKSAPFDKNMAADWFIQAAYERGIYDPSRTRGRGAWIDDGRVIFHAGNELWVDGNTMPVTAINSRYVYEMDRSLLQPADKPMTDADGLHLVEISRMFRWTKPASAALLLGFVALAPMCGALRWRPHIWVTGGAGCGKSTVMNEFVYPLLEGLNLFAQGNSTEAGIRQTLRCDALPVLFDESEQNDEREQSRVQNVLSLIRQASSQTSAMTLKGTAHGSSMQFLIRSMFCLSSIQVGMKHQADYERLTILALRPKRDEANAADNWLNLKARLREIADDRTIAARLFRRSLDMLPTTLKNINTFIDAASRKFGNVREGDQYGTLLAGCWSIYRSDLATPEQAMAMIDEFDWDEYRENIDTDESAKALTAMMETRVRIPRGGEASVFETIVCAKYGPRDGVEMSRDEANAILQRHGMKLHEGKYLLLSNNSTALSDMLRNTPYRADWRGQVLRVNGVIRYPKSVRISGLVTKCIAVPLDVIDIPTDPDYVPF